MLIKDLKEPPKQSTISHFHDVSLLVFEFGRPDHWKKCIDGGGQKQRCGLGRVIGISHSSASKMLDAHKSPGDLAKMKILIPQFWGGTRDPALKKTFFFNVYLFIIKKNSSRGAWVAQSVKRPTSARSRSCGP